MASTKNTPATEQQVPALPWKVAYNGTATAMLTPTSAIKFASSLLKQGQQVTIQHFVNGDWSTAETEQAKAMRKVGGSNYGAVAALTQFDEYMHYVLKNAGTKKGLSDTMLQEWMRQFFDTAHEIGIAKDVLQLYFDAYTFQHQE
jgi:hypothetical protein